MTSHAGRILIVEDEPAIAELVRYNLANAGFDTEIACEGRTALEMARDNRPSLIILDWMLPHVSGIEICRHMREEPGMRGVPIIMLTARGQDADKIAGLNAGADDYVTKPFSPGELVARVSAVLRRSEPKPNPKQGSGLAVGRLVLDPLTHKVGLRGQEVRLGPTEFRLLHLLMRHPGQVFSRERLLELVWDKDINVEIRTVDVHIRRLRKALGDDEDAGLIRTVRSAGYALNVEPDA